MSRPAEQDAPARAVADASAVLVGLGVLDAFGHVSVRDPDDPDTFWLPRNLSPSMVTPDAVVRHGPDGQPHEEGVPPIGERFLHAAVYRARPEVTCVVHPHAVELVSVGVVDQPHGAVLHMAGFLGTEVPRFDLSEELGRPTDLMVDDMEKGEHLAAALGGSAFLLMRGHGAVAVGRSLAEAVFRAHYAQVNARAVLAAGPLGAVQSLTAEEARLAALVNKRQAPRAWAAWRAAYVPAS